MDPSIRYVTWGEFLAFCHGLVVRATTFVQELAQQGTKLAKTWRHVGLVVVVLLVARQIHIASYRAFAEVP